MLEFTISIGISGYTTDMPDVDALLKKAEWALKQAKEDGKNSLVTLLPELPTEKGKYQSEIPVSEITDA